MQGLNPQTSNSIERVYSFLNSEINALEACINECFGNISEQLIKEISSHLLIKQKGKMIRPMLTLLASKMLDVKDNKHIKLGGAIELIHLATLLHDDVIDESQIRRSLPTAHIIWGNKASILSGDFFFSKAFQLMVASHSIPSLELLASTASMMVEGEIKQLVNLQQKTFISQDDYFKVIDYKTAKLFSAACKVAGLLINNNNIANLLAEFGYLYGLIYQIQDDAQDYFSYRTGKQQGKDFLEGKVTLPLILLKKVATKSEQVLISKIFDESRSQNDLEYILELLNKYKIKQSLSSILQDLANKAQDSLKQISIANHPKDHLQELLFWITNHQL